MKFLVILVGAFLAFSLICYFGLSMMVKDRIYENTSKIPKNQVGLVLGTSKYLPKGGINVYFKYRIDAAVLLFKKGKIDRIIVSGNSTLNYNEPKMMKEMLIQQGVPSEFVYEDHAGFTTRDSVLRAHQIFRQLRFTIISEKYHIERAVFIACCEGLNPIGFADSNLKVQTKIHIRETLARLKAVLDVLWGTPPRFLGKKININ